MTDTSKASQKMYVVYTSDYDDTRIEPYVFFDREHAIAYSRECGGSLQEMEQAPTISKKQKELIRPGASIFSCICDVDGSNTHVQEVESDGIADGVLYALCSNDKVVSHVGLRCWASDRETAANMLSALRSKWVSLGCKLGAKCKDKRYAFAETWRIAEVPSEVEV